MRAPEPRAREPPHPEGPTTDPAARSLFGQLGEWLRNSRFEPPISHNMVRDYWKAGLPRAIATARYLLRDAIEEKLPRVRVPTGRACGRAACRPGGCWSNPSS